MLYYFAALSIISFIVTALDKHRAKNQGWRVRERTLLTLAFFGGAFGELLAMVLLRHKIRKPQFYILVPLFLVLHLCVYLYFGGYFYALQALAF